MFKLFFFFILITGYSFCQKPDTVTVAFWNLENLFDTIDDPLINDEEYLPVSEKAWDSIKLDRKLNSLVEVIEIMNEGNGPDILAVCEIENKYVLNLLADKLSPGKYEAAHLESPDERGIDNGLLFNTKKFSLLAEHGDTIHLEDGYPTRLIFNAALLYGDDTIYVFVNHWPSRRSGESETEKNRVAAAEVLKNAVDKILESDPEAKIVAAGDFNDEPSDISLRETLQAVPLYCESGIMDIVNGDNKLFNLAYKKYEEGEGTYRYQNDWNMLDQIIISRSVVSGSFEYLCGTFEIFKPEIMITKEGKYKGTARPTYGGRNYLGGYSDHFPVISKFLRRSQ